MLQPWLGEVVLFPYHYVPQGWAPCEGGARKIENETALFSLLGSRFNENDTPPRQFLLPDYEEQTPDGLRYCIATAGIYPRGDLSGRERRAGEVVILAFEPQELGSGPWKPRATSPGLPGSTFIVAQSGDSVLHESYVGEVRLLEGTTAPAHWVRCDGRKVRIGEAQALYSLVGTKFGGDGRNDFAVPDLRSHEPAGARYFMPLDGVFPPQ